MALVGTLRGQLGLIIPGSDAPVPPHIRQDAINIVRSDPRIGTVHAAMEYVMLRRRAPDFNPNRDPGNGLYVNIDLLTMLRRMEAAAATRPASAPADHDDTVKLVQLLEAAAETLPLKLYRQQQHDAVVQSFVAGGIAPRRAEVETQLIAAMARLLHVPFFHELSGRLLKQADRWEREGQPAYARLARQHLVRIFREAALESPRPDVVLPAAEESAAAWRALGEPGRAAPLEDLRKRWHEAADGHAINLLPHAGPMLGDAVMARRSHDRVVTSMFVVALSGLGVLVLWLVAAVAGAVALATRPPVAELRTWRGPAWRDGALAGLVVCGPVLAAIGLLMATDPPLAWLMSYPSVLPLLLPLISLPAMAGLAARLFTAPAEPTGIADTGRKAAMLVATGLGLLALLALLLPVEKSAWSPPAGIQHLRSLGRWFTPVLVATSLSWLVVGSAMRLYARRPVGVISRACLRVLAPALLLLSGVLLIALLVNQSVDRVHEQAYARAAADPMADRLGSGWRDAFAGR